MNLYMSIQKLFYLSLLLSLSCSLSLSLSHIYIYLCVYVCVCSDSKIYSNSEIINEFEQIKNSFLSNDYPKKVIVDTINLTVNKFKNDNRPFDPSKCPVYVRLPWIGSV